MEQMALHEQIEFELEGFVLWTELFFHAKKARPHTGRAEGCKGKENKQTDQEASIKDGFREGKPCIP